MPERYGDGNGTPLQYSCLENPMDRGAQWAAVHGVAKSRTWLSNFTFTFHFHTLEKEKATHSIVLAWRVPGMEEPRGLPSMGSRRLKQLSSSSSQRDIPGSNFQLNSLFFLTLFSLSFLSFVPSYLLRYQTFSAIYIMCIILGLNIRDQEFDSFVSWDKWIL